MVEMHQGKMVLEEDVTQEYETQGFLETVFEDGKLVKNTDLSTIRENLNIELNALSE